MLGTLSSCAPGTFSCEGVDDCVDGSLRGTCEPSGFCSFADLACPSMRRYGDLAGDGLAGECVPAAGTATDTSSGSDTSTSAGTSATTLPIETEGPDDPYGTCENTSDCIDPSAVCVSNGDNRMCAPTCSAESVPSSECPPSIDGDTSGVGCLFTDEAQTILRCFAVCETIEDCPAGMICVAPVCTWEGD